MASMERRRRARDALIIQCACFFIVLTAPTTCIAGAQEVQRSLETDRAALDRLKLALDPTGRLLPWASRTNPCAWMGVQCYQNRVAVVRLSGFNFTGSVPANTLGDLDQLRTLKLPHNRFTGAFPLDLARCTNLRSLFLGYNLFSGPLPDFTRLWPRMSHFDVGFNNFSGGVPVSINALKGLLVLELQSNSFSGEIPALKFENLTRFSVANNKLEGPVPMSLQAFPESSFVGNGALCGPPTTKLCSPVSPPVAPPVALTIPGAVAPNRAPIATAPAAASSSSSSWKLSVGAIAGIVTGVFAVVLLFVIVFLCSCGCCLRHGDDDDQLEESHIGKQVTHYNVDDAPWDGHSGVQSGADYHFKDNYAMFTILRSPSNRSKRLQFLDQGQRQVFGLEELLRASAEVLGKSSMGTSYKADMAGDCVLVVKRLKNVAADRKEFETHVEKLGRLRHRHLLPLRAYYFSRDEKLIVTDFMPHGSLYSLLHDARLRDRPPLDWSSREKIALGSARALGYLHKPRVKMTHGNVKSSNILLNRDYEPYLSDYGLTSLSHPASNTTSRFTAYRAMEVTDIRNVSMQSDVYSFGVVRNSTIAKYKILFSVFPRVSSHLRFVSSVLVVVVGADNRQSTNASERREGHRHGPAPVDHVHSKRGVELRSVRSRAEENEQLRRGDGADAAAGDRVRGPRPGAAPEDGRSGVAAGRHHAIGDRECVSGYEVRQSAEIEFAIAIVWTDAVVHSPLLRRLRG